MANLLINMHDLRNLLFKPPTGRIWEKLIGKRLIVAFSGGKDSLALLSYMTEYAASHAWRITAGHINHNLRGKESLRDEKFCRDWCLKNGIDFFAVSADVKGDVEYKNRGLEHAARKLRYEILSAKANELDAYVVTAHTLNDQLESFFVDILTGASIYTLGGIAGENGLYLRPFLNVTTEMIEEYLAARKLKPIYDSSNANLHYQRSFVRQKVLTAFQGRKSELVNSVIRIQEESSRLNECLQLRTADLLTYTDAIALVDRIIFDKALEVEQRYILGKWLSIICRGGSVHVDAVMDLLSMKASKRISLPQKYLCEVTPKHIRIFPQAMVAPFELQAKLGRTELPDGTIVDVDGLDGTFVIRSRKPGDRYKGKKIKDLFEKRKIEPFDRDRAVIIENSKGIVFVEMLADLEMKEVKVVIRRNGNTKASSRELGF